MKHTDTVRQFNGTHEQLAEEIGDLYYDALADLLEKMAQKMTRDAAADLGRGRPRLASELQACSKHLSEAAQHIGEAWKICEPFARKPKVMP